MLIILMIFTLIFIITNILMIICLIVSKKSMNQREKLSPFECGFDQKSSSRMPFSLQFFLIAIIFLIFYVEIALILPAVVNLPLFSANLWFWLNNLFILILFIGLIHEWMQGALEWSN